MDDDVGFDAFNDSGPEYNGNPGIPDPSTFRRASTTTSTNRAGSEWGGSEIPDTCRICRSEGSDDEPLFYPCKCSGSIKFVHQECLMEWLAHSHKKHCELCKTPFRFTKLYDAEMPTVLPWSVFIQRALIHAVLALSYVARLFLVAAVWLVALPWLIRWAWRWIFWIADTGWARELWTNEVLSQIKPGHNAQDAMRESNATSSGPRDEPLMLTAARALANGPGVRALADSRTNPANMTDALLRTASPTPDTSILSSWTYISQLTSDPHLNRVILDIFEGQLITCVVITGFILVFLIREWVVQQQPMVHNENGEIAQQPLLEAIEVVQARHEQIRRRQDMLDEAQQRLRSLRQEAIMADALTRDDDHEPDLPEYAGRAEIERAMENATELLRNQHPPDREEFSLSVAWVIDQIRAAHGMEADFVAFLTQINAKLLALPDSELKQWQKAIRGIKREAEINMGEDVLGADEEIRREALRTLRAIAQAGQTNNFTRDLIDNVENSSEPTQAQNVDPNLFNGAHEGTASTHIEEQSLSRSRRPSHDKAPADQLNLALGLRVGPIQDVPITNAGPDAKVNVFCSSTARGRAVPEPSAPTPPAKADSSEGPAQEEQASTSGVESSNEPSDDARRMPEAASTHLRSGVEQTNQDINASGAVGPHLTEQTQSSAETRENASDQPEDVAGIQAPERPRGLLQSMSDWFWGDIELGPGSEEAPLPDEMRIRDDGRQEAPFVPIANGHARNGNNEQALGGAEAPEAGRDPEAAAAIAQAGIDPEGMDDVEDLEGILELIGLQGPLIGLMQTSAFCTVLVIGTVAAAVGLPYLWGKLVLSFLGNPLYFLLKAPLQLASFIADSTVDIALLSLSWLILGLATIGDQVLPKWLVVIRGTNMSERASALAAKVAHSSGVRLQAIFGHVDDIEQLGFHMPLLSASAHAHASLLEVKRDVNFVLQFAAGLITATVNLISAPATFQTWSDVFTPVSAGLSFLKCLLPGASEIGQYFQSCVDTIATLKTGALTFKTPEVPLDPTLVYWSSVDRSLAVLVGYLALAALAAIYVAADTPITRSPSGHKTEKMMRDSLRQAGGVLKVILIISIEMLVFPFYCGLLLDLAFLPLFKEASIATRWSFAVDHPHMFCFIHWFVGTCYMFHFALFVGMCRKILRKGVLWFIRDPDDPTFHPVRDVLERSVTTQLRKIAFSALVYGGLVILCLGGVIWTLGHAFDSIFPIHWTSSEPILEFPMDLLLYNAITPILVRILKPSDAVHSMYAWWLRRCARVLRLSHFLFDDRRTDEEGQHLRKTWISFLLMRQGSCQAHDPAEVNKIQASPEEDVVFVPDGKFVLTPCSDQYRPPKRGEAILHADETDVFIVDQEGKKNEHFAKVYIPPFFRLRITLFMMCLWVFSAFMGLCATLLPLLFGRQIFAMMLPSGSRVNDIYAYSIGAYVLGAAVFISLGLKSGLQRLTDIPHEFLSTLRIVQWLGQVGRTLRQLCKCAYVYGLIGVALPLLVAMVIQFYFILPLHTYLVSAASATVSQSVESVNATIADTVVHTINASLSTAADSIAPQPPHVLAQHTIHVLQDYCLGILYIRVLFRGMNDEPMPWVVEACRRIVGQNWLDPNVRLATRYVVAPMLLVGITTLLAPPLLASVFLFVAQAIGSDFVPSDPDWQTRFYRYSYPITASSVLLVIVLAEVTKALQRWRGRIRDEVYLVGERLHNFGEKKPPSGSKSVSRKVQ